MNHDLYAALTHLSLEKVLRIAEDEDEGPRTDRIVVDQEAKEDTPTERVPPVPPLGLPLVMPEALSTYQTTYRCPK